MSETDINEIGTGQSFEEEVPPSNLITFVGDGFTLTGRLFMNGVQLFATELPASIPLLTSFLTEEKREEALELTQQAVAIIGGVDLQIETDPPPPRD